jgi:hypothetical protein
MNTKWVRQEMATLDLGHATREARILRMIEQFAAQPSASIPKACGSCADTKGAYRALGSEHTSVEAIRQAHADSTRERAGKQARVLVVQDTTALSFNTRPGIEGLGPVGQKGTHGLMVHSGLVLTQEGVPLGVVHQQVWARDEAADKRGSRRSRRIEEKESFRWLETVDEAESQLPKQTEVWVVGDREADLFELFAMERRAGMELVVRATQDRKLVSAKSLTLYQAVEAAPFLGWVEVSVPRSRKRAARTARMEVRACAMTLEPPRNCVGRGELSPVRVHAVWVREVATVPPGQEPIEWLILTTLPVRTLAQAVAVVGAYAQRWKVETYHYVLKSGCKVEDLQLHTAERIERALALYTVVAWRLLYLTYVARKAPEMPCTAVLEEEEWRLLYAVSSRRGAALPQEPPTVREAVRRLAMLGGFLGRKGDGEPGVQSIWTGFHRLMEFSFAYDALRASPHFVGNG